jgi:hypothetical protein
VSAWWYNGIGLEKNINNYRFFLFFNFDHAFYIRVQSSEPLDTKIHLIIQVFGRWVVCAQTAIFSSKPIPKMRDYTVHFMFGAIFEESQQPTIKTKMVQHFSSNHPNIRQVGCMCTNCNLFLQTDPKNAGLYCTFYVWRDI